ncbi:MAG: V-type ATPase 116kDa subunit family protein [Clostridia bacterium]
MKKLSLVALKRDADRLARELIYLRSVQLTPLESSTDLLPKAIEPIPNDSLTQQNRQMAKTALELVSKYRKKTVGEKSVSKKDFEQTEQNHPKALAAIGRLCNINTELDEIKKTIAEEQRKYALLLPWKNLSVNPNSLETASTRTIIGIFPLISDPLVIFDSPSACDVSISEINSDVSRRYATITYLKCDETEVTSLALNNGFTRIDFDRSVENVADSMLKIQATCLILNQKLDSLNDEIKKLASLGSEIELLLDYYTFGTANNALRQKLFYTPGAVLLQGWVPEGALPLLTRVLADFECFYDLADPIDSEEPPILLKNGFFSGSFEFIISLYSMPKYRAYDPTKFISIFFFFVFGLMVQDIAYGILMSVGCLLFIKLKKPKGEFREALKMFAWCGLSTIFAGVLFGGFFGDLPNSFAKNFLGYQGEVDLALWFSPLKDPMTMLYFSLAIGIVQVMTGIIISAHMKFKNHDPYSAIVDDLSWLVIFIGGGLFAAASFGFLPFPIVGEIGKYTALTGVAIIVLFRARGCKNPILRLGKGLLGIYNIVNYASDILSYSRIMALGLSGAVIANVMNLLGTMVGPSFIGIILFVVLLVVGTLLNLFISLLGAFVHTARLQYIEFFGKFYDDGGERFVPEKADTKYTNILLEELNNARLS